MNHVYSVLWNALLGRFCVASELSRQRNTAQRAARSDVRTPRPTALAALLALAWAGQGWAQLPQGHTLAHGLATIETKGRHMTITQTTPKAILDWQSFNVAHLHQVTFQQPNRGSQVLNRVVGPDASAIRGRLQSNGQVFLVNPNGVLFGAAARVDVGGLLASALSISNDDFLAGRYRFSALPDQVCINTVVNRGEINAAEGGAVALLGGRASNAGRIRARRGLVVLAAGCMVTLDFSPEENLQVAVDESVLSALVNNSGLIQADGGSVWMTAAASDALLQTVINNTGLIQARTVGEHNGSIRLWAEGPGAVVHVEGTLDASAGQGDGGGIGIAGQQVKILPGTRITANAEAGQNGHLVVQAGHLRVGEDGVDAGVLSDTLGRNDVILMAYEGDIDVDAPVAWDQNLLKLEAEHSVHINSTMAASGTSILDITHGKHAADDELMAADSGLNMALSGNGFTGSVDFKDVLDQSDPANHRLTINGESYTLLTRTGANDSQTGVDLQGIDGQLDGRYALAADIDAADVENFKPIGSHKKPFSGKFEGLGHQIANLAIDRRQESHVGLFAASTGSTRNLALKDGRVKGADSALVIAGSIAGELRSGGSMANVHTTASVHAHSDQGESAKAIAGNLVGKIDAGNLTNAHALGSVSAEAFSRGKLAHAVAGGIAGRLQSGSVTQAHAAGPVTVSARSRRIVHRHDERGAPIVDPSLPPVYVEGTATSYAGGAIGVNGSGHTENLSATGLVTDMSAGHTTVSMHALVGNAPGATRARADRLHAVPAAPDQPMAPAMAAPPVPETNPVVVAVNAAVQAHATPAAPAHPMTPATPATPAPSPEAAAVAVAVDTVVQVRASSAPVAQPLDVAPSQAAAIRQTALAAPALGRQQVPLASVSRPSESVAGIDVTASQAVAAATPPGVDAGPLAWPADSVAQAADIRPTDGFHAAMAVAANGVVAADIAAENAQPSAAARAAAAGTQPAQTHAGLRIQNRAAYAAAMAAVAAATRGEPAPAPPAASDDPLYTVIDGGIHHPAR